MVYTQCLGGGLSHSSPVLCSYRLRLLIETDFSVLPTRIYHWYIIDTDTVPVDRGIYIYTNTHVVAVQFCVVISYVGIVN